MDKAIFQFDSSKYDDGVIGLSRDACEYLANVDEEFVTKIDLELYPLQILLNEDLLDTTNCYFRVFI